MVKKNTTKKPRRKSFGVYEKDSSGLKGHATAVLKPKTIQELKEFVRNNPKICIRGGGSGLMGGCVPHEDAVLDVRLLDEIINLDPDRRIIEVQAGITLDELNNFLFPRGLEFPFKVTSSKSATIGGLIATNSPGIRARKYGKIIEWINWIEVVNPQGASEKKSRIDLSDYAGMEGTTGVIATASLRLAPRVYRTASILSTEYLQDVVEKVQLLRQDMTVSAIELLDKRVSEALGLPFKYHLIVEYESEKGELKDEKYYEAMELLYLAYHIFLNKEERHRIEDFKVLMDRYDKIFTYIESFDIPMFSSISLGIIHPCISKEKEKYLPEIVQVVKRFGGSVNAGFGIGLVKKNLVDMNDRKLLENMKRRLDPDSKFNSGKIL